MFILDTDHVTLVNRPNSRDSTRLFARLDQTPDAEVVTTVVTYEEQVRGWLGFLAKARTVADEVEGYARLNANLDFFCKISVLPFDDRAAVQLQQLRSAKVRVGTMDLKIAAIALVTGATLLSRNLTHFRRVPGLMVQDWSA